MKKLNLILILTLLFGLALTACASSGGSSSGGSNSYNVTMTDFKFQPDTLNVSAGQTLTVNLQNTGSVQHTFTVMKTPVSGSYTQADAGNIYFNSDVIQAGSSKTVTFTAPSTAGTYQIICTVQGHLEAGMHGSLVVK